MERTTIVACTYTLQVIATSREGQQKEMRQHRVDTVTGNIWDAQASVTLAEDAFVREDNVDIIAFDLNSYGDTVFSYST